jgi:hypothetical protein
MRRPQKLDRTAASEEPGRAAANLIAARHPLLAAWLCRRRSEYLTGIADRKECKERRNRCVEVSWDWP